MLPPRFVTSSRLHGNPRLDANARVDMPGDGDLPYYLFPPKGADFPNLISPRPPPTQPAPRTTAAIC
jgi:hypothetical protein